MEKLLKAYNDKLYLQKPINIHLNQFQNENFDMTIVNPNCRFKRIEITTISKINNLIINNIKVMTSIIQLYINEDENGLYRKFFDCMALCFDDMNLDIKMTYIEYFSKVLSVTSLENKVHSNIIQIFNGIDIIIKEIPFWRKLENISIKDIEKFNRSCELFLKASVKFIDFYKDNKRTILIILKSCFCIITESVIVDNTKNIEVAAYKILIKILRITFNQQYATQIKDILIKKHNKIIPKTIHVLELCISIELITTGTSLINDLNDVILQILRYDNTQNIDYNCIGKLNFLYKINDSF